VLFELQEAEPAEESEVQEEENPAATNK